MEWGNHLFALVAFALGALPLIYWLLNSFSGTESVEPARRDIWAKPAPAWLWYAKLAAIVVLVCVLMVEWGLFMAETFTPSL
ncbi:hypothetical protein [Scandinavium goeteborgense]|uniref:Uncharacterized protein n=1 Tax=Scandinavium goeteborgense TaxID=1851514 RepID=A0A4R6DTU4_SCAGO|nr:hypothetical protein [Scandinavium goeteborgense]TDN48094.1 hypothetical protein EC847_12845 [Scandinavium goeteborgense]